MKIILFILGYLVVSVNAVADTLEVEYASFYSHVKKLDDPETNALRFTFGFQHIAHKRLCHISSGQITTQKQTLPLIVENNSRFTVPTDKILKMAKAKVVIELDDQANQCDMSVQLETLPSFLKIQYSHDELLLLFNQYQAFFDEMGGFLSFMMPLPQGLVLQFDNATAPLKEGKILLDENGNVRLSEDWLILGKGLELTTPPLRITAIIEN
ncbi:DUF2987 domain-containing protein [uncultured Paraglaciecola sp.]|uniref:DUF2987 domain-containing protein n=1 Tax=uncultured Paraglaciecola sp. TaxID=1765024 RepID=UPI0025FEC3A2|nr:DUF2987 domain-containing protein [uncultured Paraglaciecola sp.]